MNREGWLEALTALLRPVFEEAEKPLPETIRVSCGFPSTGARSKRVGEHHRATSFSSGICKNNNSEETERSEIFITPYENQSLEVAGILLHELCHAALPSGTKHGKPFKELATKLGLEGRMTATTIGEKAKELLEPLIEKLGPYPHSEMVRSFGRGAPTEQARLVTVRCGCCGFRALMERNDYVDNGYRLQCPDQCGEPLLHKNDQEAI
jgi:hypothetical protein